LEPGPLICAARSRFTRNVHARQRLRGAHLAKNNPTLPDRLHLTANPHGFRARGSDVAFKIRSGLGAAGRAARVAVTGSGLDRIDLRILAAMQEDASRSAAQIAEAVGLSQSPCWRRIQRLREEGYITKVVALLDRKKIGLRAQLFVQVKVISNDQASLAAFSAAIQEFPEVMECHIVLGMFDFLLRVVAKDLEAYEKFYFEKLSRVPNVRELNSFVAAQEVKSTTAYPLRR
jgi:Lrp/AsnC family transcriptional regulator